VCFTQSRAKGLTGLLTVLGFTAGTLLLALTYRPRGDLIHIVLCLGVPFWSWILILAARKVIRGAADKIILNRHGILDTSVSDKLIPWSAISALSVRVIGRANFLLIEMDQAFEDRWRRSMSSLYFRKAFAAIGSSGHMLATHDTDGSFDELVDAIQRFAPRTMQIALH
jgi:hypothetical protein